MKLLVLEDESRIRESLCAALREAGYAVEAASCAIEAENLVQSDQFDAFLFDVSLPEGDREGFALVQRLRESGTRTPVLYLTGRDAVEDIIAGLDSGGDDYLLKPYRLPELLARLRVQLRRARPNLEPKILHRDLCIDWNKSAVTRQDKPVHLTAREYAMLELLASQPGRIYAREEILTRIWDSSADVGSNLVEVYVGLVRRKLGDWVIENVRGRGYRFPDD
jgi:DNA-binding response OmpR family regulator